MKNRKYNRGGFTLIELMIVIGVISVLIVVLAIAVLPWLRKSDEKATRSLLTNIGQFCGQKPVPTLKSFRKDAGDLAKRIDKDDKIASGQMMLFYTAPSREEWDGSKLYRDQNYNPNQQPEDFGQFTRKKNGGLPYLVDAWEMPIWYQYDKTQKAGFILSAGEDKQWNTDDDLIFDSRNNKVAKREDLTTP